MTSSLAVSALQGRWTLPPLILHPFSGEDNAEKLLEGSKASLMMHGLIPDAGRDRGKLNDLVLHGRVQELRMLYFLGKDLTRWAEQCLDFVARTGELKDRGIRLQSFSALLVEATPKSVLEKLHVWGVTDQRSVFSRAFGITATVCDPPTSGTLTPLFLHNYHRFLDYAYICFQNLQPFTE